MSGPLFDEGLLRILSAGGCRCDPPGVGEEFCTGHCHLRAEVAQLRSDLAHAQAERDKFKQAFLDGSDKVVQLRAQVETMRGVVEAAQDVLNCVSDEDRVWDHESDGACLANLQDALDQAQAPKHTQTCACQSCIGTFGPVDTRPEVVDTTQIGSPPI